MAASLIDDLLATFLIRWLCHFGPTWERMLQDEWPFNWFHSKSGWLLADLCRFWPGLVLPGAAWFVEVGGRTAQFIYLFILPHSGHSLKSPIWVGISSVFSRAILNSINGQQLAHWLEHHSDYFLHSSWVVLMRPFLHDTRTQ